MKNGLLEDYQRMHSKFKIERFILWKHGNAWARYQQALREVDSRRESMFALKDQLKLAQIAFKGSKIKRAWGWLLNREKYEILRNQATRSLKSMSVSIRELDRELSILIQEVARLRRDKFGKLTEKDKEKLEADSWYHIAKAMAAIEIFTQGAPSKQTVELVLSMPGRVRNKLLAEINPANSKRLIGWLHEGNYGNRDSTIPKNRRRVAPGHDNPGGNQKIFINDYIKKDGLE